MKGRGLFGIFGQRAPITKNQSITLDQWLWSRKEGTLLEVRIGVDESHRSVTRVLTLHDPSTDQIYVVDEHTNPKFTEDDK